MTLIPVARRNHVSPTPGRSHVPGWPAVAPTHPDARGWKVVTGDGRTFGTIAALIAATVSTMVRYLDCAVAEAAVGLDPLDRHVLIPVERARFDTEHEAVIVDSVRAADLGDYPLYTGLPLTPDIERRVRAAYGRFDGLRSRAERAPVNL